MIVPSTVVGPTLVFQLLEPPTTTVWAPWFEREIDDLQLAGFLVGIDDPHLIINGLLIELASSSLTYMAFRRAGDVVGFFQLHEVDAWSGTAQYSAYVSRRYRRSLAAAELGLQGIELALGHFAFRKLHMYVASDNTEARRPLERLGFLHEATLPEFTRRSDGSLTDVEVLAMSAASWPEVRPRVAKVLSVAPVSA